MADLSLAQSDWLKGAEVTALLDALNGPDIATRIVGGAVRNALMGRPVGEIDMATTARPDRVMELAEKAGFGTIPTGIGHGTVTVVVSGKSFEVTTLRVDAETHGRHATVEFTDDWYGDAERRDFTINALYADGDGTVHDPLGGADDIAARRIRFIGDARERIREDYLRILRFFRFLAEYGTGDPDPAGLKASIELRSGLDQLSPERVWGELCRLVIAPRASAALDTMLGAGLLVPVLAGVPCPGVFRALADLDAALDLTPDAVRRLAALAMQVHEDVGRLKAKLRLSNAEAARLSNMDERTHRMSPAFGLLEQKEQLYRLGRQAYRDRVLLAWARDGAGVHDESWRRLFDLPQSWEAPVFPLKGADLLALGFTPSPEVGRALAQLERWWIDADFPGEDALMAAARRLIETRSEHN